MTLEQFASQIGDSSTNWFWRWGMERGSESERVSEVSALPVSEKARFVRERVEAFGARDHALEELRIRCNLYGRKSVYAELLKIGAWVY